MTDIRTGIGIDAHRFAPGRLLILGGVTIDFPLGLAGHSDADVLAHAITDALLGAAGMGDIGKLFPDSDYTFKDADSLVLLKTAWDLVSAEGWKISNIDSVVICQKPKILPYIDAMRKNFSASLGNLDPSRISIKGTTTEKMGFTGREEGIAAQAVILIRKD